MNISKRKLICSKQYTFRCKSQLLGVCSNWSKLHSVLHQIVSSLGCEVKAIVVNSCVNTSEETLFRWRMLYTLLNCRCNPSVVDDTRQLSRNADQPGYELERNLNHNKTEILQEPFRVISPAATYNDASSVRDSLTPAAISRENRSLSV